MEIIVLQAALASYHGDGVIVPTNSYGLMSEGLAAQLKQVGGKIIEEEVAGAAPIAVGAAVVTGGGGLQVSHVIHVPVVEQPGMRIGIESVRRATRAGLLAANHFGMERIAIPGIGYGENGIPYDETARAIIDEIFAFKGQQPSSITLIDTDTTMVEAFHHEISDR
jgi:O-acetyl-ADP-ribose deacetylase (regulator of RNase III)